MEGERDPSADYRLAFLKDPNGFKAEGTYEQLQELGKDASNFGEGKIHRMSPFADYKDSLVKTHWKGKEKGTMVFKTYGPKAKNIPEGCMRNVGWKTGPFPKKDVNSVFTYYFYNKDFKEGANTLGLAPCMDNLLSEPDSDAN